MGSLNGHAFGESCCESDDLGQPHRFGEKSMGLLPDVATVLQIETAQLRTYEGAGINRNDLISNATLKFEASGYKWSTMYHGDVFKGDETADAVYDIRAERSSYSMPSRMEKNNVAARILTDASVQWSVPSVNSHVIVSSPDLSPLLAELRTLRDWSETSTITLVLTPVPGSTGGREYKLLTGRFDELFQSVDEMLLFFITCPIQIYTLQRTRLFEGTNSGLEVPPAERSDTAAAKFRRTFVTVHFCLAALMFPLLQLTLLVKLLTRDIPEGSIAGSIEAVGMISLYAPLYWWNLGFYLSFWLHFVSQVQLLTTSPRAVVVHELVLTFTVAGRIPSPLVSAPPRRPCGEPAENLTSNVVWPLSSASTSRATPSTTSGKLYK
jgi:hypothetical protein